MAFFDLIAEGILDDVDISCRHRDADRHLVQAELRRFSSGDAEIAVERRDESSGDCVSVYGGDGRTRVLENPEVRRTVVSIPFANLVQIAAGKNVKAVLKVDTGREHVALAGQDDWCGLKSRSSLSNAS